MQDCIIGIHVIRAVKSGSTFATLGAELETRKAGSLTPGPSYYVRCSEQTMKARLTHRNRASIDAVQTILDMIVQSFNVVDIKC